MIKLIKILIVGLLVSFVVTKAQADINQISNKGSGSAEEAVISTDGATVGAPDISEGRKLRSAEKGNTNIRQ